jgi:hypothetical protein
MSGDINWNSRPQDTITAAKEKAAAAESPRGLTVLELAFYKATHRKKH